MFICVDSYMYVCFDHIYLLRIYLELDIFQLSMVQRKVYSYWGLLQSHDCDERTESKLSEEEVVLKKKKRSGIEASEMDAEVSEQLSLVGSKMLKKFMIQ